MKHKNKIKKGHTQTQPCRNHEEWGYRNTRRTHKSKTTLEILTLKMNSIDPAMQTTQAKANREA